MNRICILIISLFSTAFGQNVISGKAYNSFDHTPFQGATVTLLAKDGTLYTTQSASNGVYAINVPTGIYNFNITAPGKWYSNINPLDVSGNLYSYDFALVDVETGMNFEFLVFWGAQPKDLDAYLFTPFSCNASFKAPDTCNGPSNAIARWAYDVKSGWGPESIQLKDASPGRYEFWVNLVQTSGTDTFGVGDGMKAPVAFFNYPTTESTPQKMNVASTKDPTKVWWRAIQLIVPNEKRYPFTWSFPNELYSSPPEPWGLEDPTPVTSTSGGAITETSTSGDATADTTSSGIPSNNSSTTVDQSTVSSASSSTGVSNNSSGNGWKVPFSVYNSTAAIANQPGCTDEEIKSCQAKMTSCVGLKNTTEITCNCFMDLGDCLSLYGCMKGSKESFEKQCSNAGCNQSKCESFASSGNKLLHSWVAVFLIVVSALGMTR